MRIVRNIFIIVKSETNLKMYVEVTKHLLPYSMNSSYYIISAKDYLTTYCRLLI